MKVHTARAFFRLYAFEVPQRTRKKQASSITFGIRTLALSASRHLDVIKLLITTAVNAILNFKPEAGKQIFVLNFKATRAQSFADSFWTKHASEAIHPGFESQGRRQKGPKQGNQWPHKKGLVSFRFWKIKCCWQFLNKTFNGFLFCRFSGMRPSSTRERSGSQFYWFKQQHDPDHRLRHGIRKVLRNWVLP